jgi:hypothetical protein
MKDWTGWKRMVWTLVLVFVGAFLAQLAAQGFNVWDTDLATYQQAVNAGLAAVIALVLNILAPMNGQYGIGKTDA